MAQVFSTTNASVPAPVMSGGYYPGIDRPLVDGRGLVQPWGGGPLSRQFQMPVVIGQEPTPETNFQQLMTLMIQALPMGGGGQINYNFEGLVGPAGMPGPAGPTSFVFARDVEGNMLTAPTRVLDDGAVPGTVANVSATAMIQAVMLEWDANSELDIDHYIVYRHTSDASGSSSAIMITYATLCVDGNRTGGTEYFYWVKAVDYVGNVSAAYSTSVSATPTNVETADIVTLNADKVLISGTTYLSNWRHSSDVTKIDGGDIYASSITLTKAANDLKGLTGDQAASGGSSLLPNWRLDIADSSGRPAGIYPVESVSDFSQVDWLDSGEDEIKILSTPDTVVGYGFPAIPIDDKQIYTVVVRHKSSAASTDGLYLGFQQYNAALPATKTHIGSSGGANAEARTNYGELVSAVADAALPGTSWAVNTYTYTPTSGTKYASFSMYLGNPDTAEVEYHVDYVLMYLVPKTADEIADGSTNFFAGGDWKHGSDVTKIDGGDIYTSSILAASISTYNLTSVNASIENLMVKTAHIDNLNVTTGKLENNATSVFNSAETSGTIDLQQDTWVTIQTVAITSEGVIVLIFGSTELQATEAAAKYAKLGVFWGATLIAETEQITIPATSIVTRSITGIRITGSGAQTFYLKAMQLSAGTFLRAQVRHLGVQESKGK